MKTYDASKLTRKEARAYRVGDVVVSKNGTKTGIFLGYGDGIGNWEDVGEDRSEAEQKKIDATGGERVSVLWIACEGCKWLFPEVDVREKEILFTGENRKDFVDMVMDLQDGLKPAADYE